MVWWYPLRRSKVLTSVGLMKKIVYSGSDASVSSGHSIKLSIVNCESYTSILFWYTTGAAYGDSHSLFATRCESQKLKFLDTLKVHIPLQVVLIPVRKL